MKIEKSNWAARALDSIKTSTVEIVYGVGDALWGAATMPEKALKYWTGVDERLGSVYQLRIYARGLRVARHVHAFRRAGVCAAGDSGADER